MDDLKKNLCEVYELLKGIPVSGDAVDRMYAIRIKLRQAYQLAEANKKEKEDENDV